MLLGDSDDDTLLLGDSDDTSSCVLLRNPDNSDEDSDVSGVLLDKDDVVSDVGVLPLCETTCTLLDDDSSCVLLGNPDDSDDSDVSGVLLKTDDVVSGVGVLPLGEITCALLDDDSSSVLLLLLLDVERRFVLPTSEL